MEAFGRFLDVLDELREKCPWDRKQTNESLRPNTIEEVYELCDALINEDETNICKELGDVLLHIAFYAKIASEKGQFDVKDVCDRLCEKLIFRHPHVFGEKSARNATESLALWEEMKKQEKKEETLARSSSHPLLALPCIWCPLLFPIPHGDSFGNENVFRWRDRNAFRFGFGSKGRHSDHGGFQS